jgi:hypothetical protein
MMKETLLMLRTLTQGPGPLKRRIAAQGLLLEQEWHLTKIATHQLRETTIARLTSPLALGVSCAAGFCAGSLSPHSLKAAPYFRFALRQAAWPLIFAGFHKLQEKFSGHADEIANDEVDGDSAS